MNVNQTKTTTDTIVRESDILNPINLLIASPLKCDIKNTIIDTILIKSYMSHVIVSLSLSV